MVTKDKRVQMTVSIRYSLLEDFETCAKADQKPRNRVFNELIEEYVKRRFDSARLQVNVVQDSRVSKV
jgi:metal-responsive CopG/Arc/MetJ family transcriptional regulator